MFEPFMEGSDAMTAVLERRVNMLERENLDLKVRNLELMSQLGKLRGVPATEQDFGQLRLVNG